VQAPKELIGAYDAKNSFLKTYFAWSGEPSEGWHSCKQAALRLRLLLKAGNRVLERDKICGIGKNK
jgi:hypothetical protein